MYFFFILLTFLLHCVQTYDRAFIQKWLKSGNRTCPRTQQVLSHTILTPNHLIKEMILQWCKNHGIKLSDFVQYSDEDGLTGDGRDQFLCLLEKMWSTLSDQKDTARKTVNTIWTIRGHKKDSYHYMIHKQIYRKKSCRVINCYRNTYKEKQREVR